MPVCPPLSLFPYTSSPTPPTLALAALLPCSPLFPPLTAAAVPNPAFPVLARAPAATARELRDDCTANALLITGQRRAMTWRLDMVPPPGLLPPALPVLVDSERRVAGDVRWRNGQSERDCWRRASILIYYLLLLFFRRFNYFFLFRSISSVYFVQFRSKQTRDKTFLHSSVLSYQTLPTQRQVQQKGQSGWMGLLRTRK